MDHLRAEESLEQSVEGLALRLDNHISDYKLHKTEVAMQLQAQTDTINKNTAAVTSLTEALSKLTTATTGVVEAYTTANNVQRFVKWLAAFGVLAAAMGWLGKVLTNHVGG